jgi:phosphatidylethanolamine-binding protein (PEBP) family uncharacterized protein
MGRTRRIKRHTRFFEKMRQRREKRTSRRVQRGGNSGPPLLENSDAPQVVPQGNIEFNVRFQPTVKANEHGPKFTTYQTAHEPYPIWTTPPPQVKYAIVCWDPDVKDGKSFLHWLVVNCTGMDTSDGKIIASWQPPSPPPGSGEHRYLLGLMKQEKDLDIPEMTQRLNFNPTEFAKQHGLTPIAYRGFRVETPPIFVAEAPAAPPPPPPPPPPVPQAPA